MRKYSALLVFLALPVFPAFAAPEIRPGQDGGPDKPVLIQFGNYFFPIAKTFGCNDFRWAAFGPGKQTMSFEYVPAGDDVNGWTRLMTVTVYPLPQLTGAQSEAMRKIREALLGAPKERFLLSSLKRIKTVILGSSLNMRLVRDCKRNTTPEHSCQLAQAARRSCKFNRGGRSSTDRTP